MSMLTRLAGSSSLLRAASRSTSRVAIQRTVPYVRSMSSYPGDRKYVKTHEWLKPEGDAVVVGITDHAQKELGDVVFLEIPDVGDSFDAEQKIGVIESVKAVSDLVSPISGTIVEVNEKLSDSPELVNKDPHGDAWFVKMKPTNKADLDGCMSAEEYDVFVASE